MSGNSIELMVRMPLYSAFFAIDLAIEGIISMWMDDTFRTFIPTEFSTPQPLILLLYCNARFSCARPSNCRDVELYTNNWRVNDTQSRIGIMTFVSRLDDRIARL